MSPPRWLADEGGATSSVPFGQPVIQEVTGHCATVEFPYFGDGDGPGSVNVFARRREDPEFLQWGRELKARRVVKQYGPRNIYAVLVRGLPVGEEFAVQIASGSFLGTARSPASARKSTQKTTTVPMAPQVLQTHRTDPRLNLKQHDHSVCIDLHWSHPHLRLAAKPADVYFRVKHAYEGEEDVVFCEDKMDHLERQCGSPLHTVGYGLPSRYATLCGLRPKRRIRFLVESFTCDDEVVAEECHVTTPPSAPSVVARLVTQPQPQESIAGFRPHAVFDWIPQHDDMILGHAVYLGLTQVSALRLLCWVPVSDAPGVSGGRADRDLVGHFSSGHISLPVVHGNYTFAEHASLYGAYLNHLHVHQEQEVGITTRVAGRLESPAFTHRLGEWLVLDTALKCLTSFDATRPTYVASEIPLSWTQEQALSQFSGGR